MAAERGQVKLQGRCRHPLMSSCFRRYLGVTPPISTSESNKREKEVTITLMEELRRQNTFETEEESRRRWAIPIDRRVDPRQLAPSSQWRYFYGSRGEIEGLGSLLFRRFSRLGLAIYTWGSALVIIAPSAFNLWQWSRNREIVLGRVAALVKKFVRTVSMSRGLSEAAANAAGGKIFTFGSYRLGVHGPGTDIDTLCVVPKHVSRDDFFEVFEPMLREIEGATEVSVRVIIPGACSVIGQPICRVYQRLMSQSSSPKFLGFHWTFWWLL